MDIPHLNSMISQIETDYQKFKLVKSAGISLTHLGNYQIEHLQGIRGLTIIKQIPIILKMWSCGMLFNRCAYNPIPISSIVNKLFSVYSKYKKANKDGMGSFSQRSK